MAGAAPDAADPFAQESAQPMSYDGLWSEERVEYLRGAVDAGGFRVG